MKKMYLFRAVLAMALMLFCALPAMGQTLLPPVAQGAFAGVGTAIGTTNSYYVVSANGPGVPRIQYINASSDLTNATVTFWTVGSPSTATAAAAASQTTVSVATNGFAAGNTIILRSVAADTYQRATISSLGATNIVLVENVSTALVAGDLIYKCTAGAVIPMYGGAVGVSSTLTREVIATGGVYSGPPGKPILIDITSTTVGKLNAVSGIFDRTL